MPTREPAPVIISNDRQEIRIYTTEKEVVIFSPEEASKILNAAGRHLATPFIAIGCFEGLRSEEIKRLDWKNVNFERGFIEVRADICKTKARRLVPISDNLRAWLKPFAMPSGAAARRRVEAAARERPRHSQLVRSPLA